MFGRIGFFDKMRIWGNQILQVSGRIESKSGALDEFGISWRKNWILRVSWEETYFPGDLGRKSASPGKLEIREKTVVLRVSWKSEKKK